jgi:hypothetical protein
MKAAIIFIGSYRIHDIESEITGLCIAGDNIRCKGISPILLVVKSI